MLEDFLLLREKPGHGNLLGWKMVGSDALDCCVDCRNGTEYTFDGGCEGAKMMSGEDIPWWGCCLVKIVC